MTDDRGQALVEVLWLVPITAAVIAALASAGAWLASRSVADAAAEVGAIAMIERTDPSAAARRSLPGWARGSVLVGRHPEAVTVRVSPSHLPSWLGGLVGAESTIVPGPIR